MEEKKKTKSTKKPNILDEAGWRRKNSDGKSGFQYKVLVCPTGGKPRDMPIVWERPEGVEPQELWVTPKEVTLEWLQKKVGGNIETIQAIDGDVPDDTLIGVFNEDGIGLQLERNHLVGEWMVDMSAEFYGPALIMPAKLMQ